MAKIKYNVKGVDAKGDRPLPKPGVYRCKIVSCVDAKPSGKDRRLEVQYEVTEGDHKGFKLYDYINLESEAAAWKLAQFIKACGLPESGNLDPDELIGTALSVRTRVDAGNEQYAPSAKPATLMPLDGDAEEDEELEEEDDEDESEEEEDSDDEEDDDEDDETYSREELESGEYDLEEVAGELEVDFPSGKLTAKKKAALIDALLAAQDSGDGEEDDDDEEEDEEDEEEIDYSAMSAKELKDALAESDVKISAKVKALKGAKLKAALVKLAEENLVDSEDEEDEDEPDYDAMEPKELKALAKERGLDTKGSKKILIARLQKDDQPF